MSIINLKDWLKSNDTFALKNAEHAYKLKKVAEAEDYKPIAFEQYMQEVKASMELIALHQSEGSAANE